MTSPSIAGAAGRRKTGWGWIVTTIVVVVVLVAMGLDTKYVSTKTATADSGAFSPESFGQSEFPKVQASIEKRAVDAPTLAKAIAQDQDAASKKYGVQGDVGAEMPVKFTGVAGKGDSGIYTVKVPDMPGAVAIRVQTGPAINGTELRDSTGTISFGQFKNQIEYQNAGAALNTEMKKEVLAKVDAKALTGKTITVTGVFTLINPNNWLVTPVRLSVQ